MRFIRAKIAFFVKIQDGDGRHPVRYQKNSCVITLSKQKLIRR